MYSIAKERQNAYFSLVVKLMVKVCHGSWSNIHQVHNVPKQAYNNLGRIVYTQYKLLTHPA